jgi:hypothetical protein
MNTNPSSKDNDQLETQEDEGETLIQLLEELDNIDEGSEEAAINKFSISDNNGGRIELMKRQTHKLSAFLFLRRLMHIARKIVKPEQEDGA